MNQAIFLDRDGTLNIDKGYLYKFDDWEFTKGAVEAIKIFNKLGYKVIVISNQSGIGRGYYTSNDVKVLHNQVDKILQNAGAKIEAWYFCPHAPWEICNCRKPKTGLVERAVKEHKIDTTKSWFVGDKESDVMCAKRMKIHACLLPRDYSDIYAFARMVEKMKKNDVSEYLELGKEARLKKWVDKQGQKNTCEKMKINADSYFVDERVAGIEDITTYSSTAFNSIFNTMQQYFSGYYRLDELTKITANLLFLMQPEEKTVRQRYRQYALGVWNDLDIPEDGKEETKEKKTDNMPPTFYYPM